MPEATLLNIRLKYPKNPNDVAKLQALYSIYDVINQCGMNILTSLSFQCNTQALIFRNTIHLKALKDLAQYSNYVPLNTLSIPDIKFFTAYVHNVLNNKKNRKIIYTKFLETLVRNYSNRRAYLLYTDRCRDREYSMYNLYNMGTMLKHRLARDEINPVHGPSSMIAPFAINLRAERERLDITGAYKPLELVVPDAPVAAKDRLKLLALSKKVIIDYRAPEELSNKTDIS